MKTLGTFLGIIGFLLLITIHEGGHFAVAKLLGIRVNEFSVGMGPVLYTKKKKGTVYSFRALPVGGYCSFQGELPEDVSDDDLYKDEDPDAYINQPWWKQALVLIAGSAINFLAGFLIIFAAYLIVAKGQYGLGRILEVSWSVVTDIIKDLFAFLSGLFNGSSSVNDLSSVVGIVSVVAESASAGMVNVLYLIGILSVNLSVMNLLPIPALDGGRLLLVFIKAVIKDRYSNKAETVITVIGVIFMLILIVLLTFKDIWVLFR